MIDKTDKNSLHGKNYEICTLTHIRCNTYMALIFSDLNEAPI